jgi:hypothetical protein
LIKIKGEKKNMDTHRRRSLSPFFQFEDLELLNLDLDDPRERPHLEGEEFRPRIHTPRNFGQKASKTWLSLSMLTFITLFIILYSVYIHQALLSPTPRIGSLMLSASDTNLFVSILSQFFSEALQHLCLNAFDSAKWALAGRTKGVSMTTFFVMSGATQWLTALFLTINDLPYHIWGPIRSVSHGFEVS